MGKLADCVDEGEDIQLDTTEIDQDMELARKFLMIGETESSLDIPNPCVADEAPEQSAPDGRKGGQNIQ